MRKAWSQVEGELFICFFFLRIELAPSVARLSWPAGEFGNENITVIDRQVFCGDVCGAFPIELRLENASGPHHRLSGSISRISNISNPATGEGNSDIEP